MVAFISQGKVQVNHHTLLMNVQVAERLKKIIDLRVKATEQKHGEVRLPRVMRLCHKYDLTDKETAIMLYLLTYKYDDEQDSNKSPFSSYHTIEAVHVCSVLDISFLEIFNFVNQDRLHIQQGLFPNIQQNYILNMMLELDHDMYFVLQGASLKQKDFLKIDQTFLADVIFEEPEYHHLREQKEDSKLKQSATASTKEKG